MTDKKKENRTEREKGLGPIKRRGREKEQDNSERMKCKSRNEGNVAEN